VSRHPQINADVREAARGDEKRNFLLIFLATTLTRFGDAVANPKTVLAWLISFVGAPGFLFALLVPIRESGSMLPQIFIGGFLRRRPLRRGVWILSNLMQSASVLCMGLAAWLMKGAAAGWAILVCVAAFSLARSLSSVAGKDLLGKAVPKGRRGRLTGLATGVSGLLAVGFGIFMTLGGGRQENPAFYGGLLAGGGALWLLAAAVLRRLREQPGETAAGGDSWRDSLSRLDLLRTDRVFRRFLVTRTLLLCSALSGPFYVLLARERADGGAAVLGGFILASGLANGLSAPVWGVMADRSSRRVLIRAALLTAAMGIAVFCVVKLLPGLAGADWLYPAAFFVLGVAHGGVRAGRKTYVVDLARGVKRTDYIAVGNTVMGVILLLVGVVTGLLTFLGPEEMILFMSLAGLAGAAAAFTLPEVE